MKRSGYLLLVLFASLAHTPTVSTEGLRSYLQARRVLDAGVEAMGGLEAVRSVKTVRRQLAGGWTNPFQGQHPYAVAGPSLTPPPTLFSDEFLSFIDYGGNRWFESLNESNSSGDRILQIDVVTGDAGFESFAYFDEKPIYHPFDASDLPSLRAEKFRRYPEGLLRMALDRPETLQWVGAAEEFGRKQQVISFADSMGTRLLLYFDQESSLLTKSEYLREQAVVGDTYAEVLYSDYRQVGNLKLPFHYMDRVAGLAIEDVQASSIEVNAALPEERFQPPQSFAAAVKDPPGPQVEKLGDNLYLIRGAYNVVFANFKDHVAVFEAPLNSGYAEACLRLIRKALPGRPIRYLISTHFHSDHLGGVRPYIAEGVSILTTPDAKGVIEQIAASRRTLHPDALSKTPRSPVIETIADNRVLDDGSYRAELYDFGPTDHVAQILVAYFPKEKLLFEPDLLDITSQDLVLTGPEGVTLAEKIRQLGLQVERIIPVHGAPGTTESLNQALAVRARHVH